MSKKMISRAGAVESGGEGFFCSVGAVGCERFVDLVFVFLFPENAQLFYHPSIKYGDLERKGEEKVNNSLLPKIKKIY